MAGKVWRSGGKMVRVGGKIVRCADCPCEPVTCCCDPMTTLYATVEFYTVSGGVETSLKTCTIPLSPHLGGAVGVISVDPLNAAITCGWCGCVRWDSCDDDCAVVTSDATDDVPTLRVCLQCKARLDGGVLHHDYALWATSFIYSETYILPADPCSASFTHNYEDSFAYIFDGALQHFFGETDPSPNACEDGFEISVDGIDASLLYPATADGSGSAGATLTPCLGAGVLVRITVTR